MKDIEEFKTKYPGLYETIFDDGIEAGYDDGFAKGEASGIEKGKTEGIAEAKVEGAKAERERIQSVEAQLIPGHEKLIQTLKFDGETTGEQAAVKILQAEKNLRINVAQQLDQDAPDAVAAVAAPEVETTVALPEGPDKWRAEYEKDSKLQAEFKTYETYAAFRKGISEGRVKIFGKEVK